MFESIPSNTCECQWAALVQGTIIADPSVRDNAHDGQIIARDQFDKTSTTLTDHIKISNTLTRSSTLPPSDVAVPSITYSLNPWITDSYRISLDRPIIAHRPRSQRRNAERLSDIWSQMDDSSISGPISRRREKSNLHVVVGQGVESETGLRTAGSRLADEYLCFPDSTSSALQECQPLLGGESTFAHGEREAVLYPHISPGPTRSPCPEESPVLCVSQPALDHTQEECEDHGGSGGDVDRLRISENVKLAIRDLTGRYMRDLSDMLVRHTLSPWLMVGLSPMVSDGSEAHAWIHLDCYRISLV